MTPASLQGSLAIPDGVLPRSVTDTAPTDRSVSSTETTLPGLFMSSDHRYWMNGKGPLPSVTTILRVLDKPALSSWYKRQVAEAAVKRHQEWFYSTMTEDDAIRWLMSMPDSTRDNAAGRGTTIHGLVDVAGRSQDGQGGFEVSPEYQDAMTAFQGFLGVSGGSQAIVSSEKAILNLSEGYAGTFDLLMLLKDELWLIDVKTGKGVYPDYALQLAGYGMAEHIALPGDPTLYDFPQPARYGVLHLRPDKYAEGYRLIEYQITDRERIAFLAALELWRWMQERSPRIQL